MEENTIEIKLQNLEDSQKAFMRSIAKARRLAPAPFFYEKSIKMIKQLSEENKKLIEENKRLKLHTLIGKITKGREMKKMEISVQERKEIIIGLKIRINYLKCDLEKCVTRSDLVTIEESLRNASSALLKKQSLEHKEIHRNKE